MRLQLCSCYFSVCVVQSWNLIFIFPLNPFYSEGQRCNRCERERENKLVHYSTAYSAFAELKVTALYDLLSPMYYSQVTCTFFFDF